MGLKTKNFYVDSLREILPEAYAVVRSVATEPHGQGVATIGVHRTRELAIDHKVTPLHEEKIYFTVDRATNDRETAYKKATLPYLAKTMVVSTGEVIEIEKYPFFYGWENDILTEDETDLSEALNDIVAE